MLIRTIHFIQYLYFTYTYTICYSRLGQNKNDFREDIGAWSTVPGAGSRLSVNRSEHDKPEPEHSWLRHESELQAARLISIITQ